MATQTTSTALRKATVDEQQLLDSMETARAETLSARDDAQAAEAGAEASRDDAASTVQQAKGVDGVAESVSGDTLTLIDGSTVTAAEADGEGWLVITERRYYESDGTTWVASSIALPGLNSSGELADVPVFRSATIADLKSVTPTANMEWSVDGYNAAGDGGGGRFRWVPGDQTAADDVLVFESSVSGYGPGEANEGRWRRQMDGQPISVAWAGADPNAAIGQEGAIQAAIDAAGARGLDVLVPAIYPIAAPVDLKGFYNSVRGVGQMESGFRALSDTASPLIDAWESGSNPTGDAPLLLSDLKLDGDQFAVQALRIRGRHNNKVSNLFIVDCFDVAIEVEWDFISLYENVNVKDCDQAVVSHGVSHRTQWNSCSFRECNDGASPAVYYEDIEGNSWSVEFHNCDFEFCSGIGFESALRFTVQLVGCYFEKNRGGEVKNSSSDGLIQLIGGHINYNEGGAPAFIANGGYIRAVGTSFTPAESSGRHDNIIHGSGGLVKLEDTRWVIAEAGDGLWDGRPVDWGPAAPSILTTALAPGDWDRQHLNGGMTSQTNGNIYTEVEVTTAGGVSLYCPTETGWYKGGEAFVLIEFWNDTSEAFDVQLASSEGGAPPKTVLGTLPITGQNAKTYVKFDASLGTDEYTHINIIAVDGLAVGERFRLYGAWIFDSRLAMPSNIYKPRTA